jgi:hypothetical protein
MPWTRRKSLLAGVPLTIVPALAFLPALAYLVITPVTHHASVLAVLTFPIFAVAEAVGIGLLASVIVRRPFDLLTVSAFAALLALLVIAAYTGLFLAAIAGRM